LIFNEHPRYLWKRLAAVFVFLYLGTMIILSLSDLKAVFEPPLLLPIMNTIFAGLIPIAVSIIAARGYLFSGLNSLLFMGCGMMTFGCAAVLAGWLISGQQGPNVNVTIYNTGALLESGAQPSQLKLELTESIVLENVEDTISKMREIKALGGQFLNG